MPVIGARRTPNISLIWGIYAFITMVCLLHGNHYLPIVGNAQGGGCESSYFPMHRSNAGSALYPGPKVIIEPVTAKSKPKPYSASR